MSGLSGDELLVQPSTVACPGHGEHLRASWPKGAVAWSMTIVRAALASDELTALFPGEYGSKQFDPAKANAIFAQRPMCYFCTREQLRDALMAAEIGRVGLCRVCGNSGVGGPYTVEDMGHKRELEHVCFECALNIGESIHRAHPKGGVWKT